MKVLVPVSGGKDSQACLKLAVAEYGAEQVVGLFCDTQFEHPETYRHVDRIAELYGVAGLIELGRMRGYRNPQAWAHAVWNSRKGRRKSA